jgi:hypothetical protein
MQPIADIRYNVIDAPIAIIKIELFDMTYITVDCMNPGAF